MNAKQRVRLCQKYLAAGVTQREICDRLQMSLSTVSRIKNANGEPIVLKKGGRKPCITAEMRNFIDLNLSCDATITDGQMTELVNKQFGASVSVASVRRARVDLKFQFRPPKTCQDLTPDQITFRVEFCRWILEHQGELKNLIFSDESRFERSPDNGWRLIRRGTWNETCFCRKSKFPQGVMVWGAVGVGFRTRLVRCSKGVGSREYIGIIQQSRLVEEANRKFGQGQWIFVQDGAPAHTSKETLDYFASQKVKVMPGWPPNSPDLNPIEMIWGILKKRVSGKLIDSDNCFSLLTENWELLAEASINSLVNSFVHRCQLVLQLAGASATPYLSSGRSETPPIALPAPLWSPAEEERLQRLRAEYGTRWDILERLMEKDRRLIRQRCKMLDQQIRNLACEPLPPPPPIHEMMGSVPWHDSDSFLDTIRPDVPFCRNE